MSEAKIHMDAVLSDCAWERVCEMLNNDIASLDNKGICIIASSRSDEPVIGVTVEHERMNWIVGQIERPLSQAILDDNPHYPNGDEIERIISGLRVTIALLEAALARRRAVDAVYQSTLKCAGRIEPSGAQK